MDDWRVIPEFPKYSVNSLGQVRRDSTGRLVRPQINQYGVPFVGLMDEWAQKQRGLAKLVARMFLDPPALEAFDTPINLDGNRLNCYVDNLMWRPRWFAIQYQHQFKERTRKLVKTPIRDLATEEIYEDVWVVVTTYGLLERDVVMSIDHRTYVWPTYQLFGLA